MKTLQFTEEELKYLFEVTTAYTQVKYKGVNTKVEPIRAKIKGAMNEIVQARIDELKREMLALEKEKVQ